MKIRIRFTRFTLNALLIALFLLSVFIAIITYQYKIVVRGVLGLVVMSLLFFYAKVSDLDVMSIDTLLASPKKGRLFVLALVVPIISYWATRQIIEMVVFFVKR